MPSILKNTLTFNQFKRIFAAGIFLFLLIGIPFLSQAMSEDDYAAMAAENMILLHEAGGDPQAIRKASENFSNKFSPEKMEEYIMMARQLMQDEALARRISEKVVAIISARGYSVENVVESAPTAMRISP